MVRTMDFLKDKESSAMGMKNEIKLNDDSDDDDLNENLIEEWKKAQSLTG
jgi:hypothetical protein